MREPPFSKGGKILPKHWYNETKQLRTSLLFFFILGCSYIKSLTLKKKNERFSQVMGSTQDFIINQVLDNHIFLKCPVDWSVSLALTPTTEAKPRTLEWKQAGTKTQWDLFLHPAFKSRILKIKHFHKPLSNTSEESLYLVAQHIRLSRSHEEILSSKDFHLERVAIKGIAQILPLIKCF